MLTDQDRARVAQAVAQAEASTSGEIVCVLARHVSAYAEVPLIWGAAAAIIAPPLALALGFDPAAALAVLGVWTAGQDGVPGPGGASVFAAYALVQTVIFAAAAALVWIPQVRRLLTPAALKRRRVSDAAMAQLAAAALAAGSRRAAVVIFACGTDHMVEIRATEAVHARADAGVWDAAARAVSQAMARNAAAEGFIEAVRLCAEPLSRHFPAQGPDANAVSDRPLEL